MSINARELIDTELIEFISHFQTVDISSENIEALRDIWRVSRQAPLEDSVASAGADLSEHWVPGPEGAPAVGVRIYRPSLPSSHLGCIFHIHGGGYIGGDAAGLESVHRAMCQKLNCAIVTVNYRLAPETRFPGSVEDCYAALSWLFSHAKALVIDRNRIGIMGESAGGGLAAALALLVRDRRHFSLAFQHLIYPMLDDRTCISKDPHPFTGQICWTPQNNYFGWSALLGKAPGSNDVSQYAAPARAENLAGLPPTFIATASLDLFVEENMEYARRLMRQGVPTELHVYPGAFHGFDMHPTATVARAARRDSHSALARFLGSA
jgi:acetyl esterase/lipase